jgi:hypothetical protein
MGDDRVSTHATATLVADVGHGALRLISPSGKVRVRFCRNTIVCCAGQMPEENSNVPTPAARELRLPFSLTPAGPIDLVHGIVDRGWGSRIEHSSFGRVEVETAAGLWAYAYIVPLPAATGDAVAEIELQVTKGRIGLAVLGKGLADLDLVLWVDEQESTKVLFLPVADLEATMGLLFRNGTPDGAPSKFMLMSARLLKL